MTTIALINLNALTTRIALTRCGNLLGNHFKVHHVVAWWRLMTLSTIGCAWRWMLKLSDGPLRGGVA